LIILTSDHGEEFWEHGGYEHGHTLYNELLWVPLIIKLPQSASKGQISTAVSTQSIMPTVLDVCGIDYDSKYLSAESLSSLWRHNPNAFQRPMISTGVLYYEDRESVIFDGLKYIRSLLTNREELFYDLTRIPQEQISTLSSSPDKVQRARNTLREHNQASAKLRDHYGVTDGEEIKFDKEIARQLKSLGYIQ
jgi:arylsulfatase A-like enzyme